MNTIQLTFKQYDCLLSPRYGDDAGHRYLIFTVKAGNYEARCRASIPIAYTQSAADNTRIYRALFFNNFAIRELVADLRVFGVTEMPYFNDEGYDDMVTALPHISHEVEVSARRYTQIESQCRSFQHLKNVFDWCRGRFYPFKPHIIRREHYMDYLHFLKDCCNDSTMPSDQVRDMHWISQVMLLPRADYDTSAMASRLVSRLRFPDYMDKETVVPDGINKVYHFYLEMDRKRNVKR